MLQSETLRNNLESKSDLEWFDAICELLKRRNHPKTHQLTELIGREKPNPSNEIRGSKFLIPYDKRFAFACINPNLFSNDTDKSIEFFAAGGVVEKANYDFGTCWGHGVFAFGNYRKKSSKSPVIKDPLID